MSNKAFAMHANDKKAFILQNTLQLIKKHGLSRSSMDSIAQASGVSKKTLYVFFTDKEQLLMQALELEAREVREVLTAIQAKKIPLAEYWCQVLHAFAHRIYAYSPKLIMEFNQCMLLIAWADVQKTQIAALISEATDSILQQQKVEVLLRSFLGVLSRSLTRNSYKIQLKELENTVIPFYCRGVYIS